MQISELPYDVRLLILSFADIDTRRYAGLLPRKLSPSLLTTLEQQLQDSSAKIEEMTLVLALPKAKEEKTIIAHYMITPSNHAVIRSLGRLTVRNAQLVAMYHEYEVFKYSEKTKMYEATIKLSAY